MTQKQIIKLVLFLLLALLLAAGIFFALMLLGQQNTDLTRPLPRLSQ
jgi:uncharacterized protein HemY